MGYDVEQETNKQVDGAKTAWPRRVLASGDLTPAVWSFVVIIFCVIVAAGAAMVLYGWAHGNAALTTLFPVSGPMRWSTAVALLLIAPAVLLKQTRRHVRVLFGLSDVLALAALVFAVCNLFSLLFETTPGIPHQIYIQTVGIARHYVSETVQWRMTLGAGMAIVGLAVATLLMDRMRRLSVALLSCGVMFSLAALCGFLFRARQIFGTSIVDAMGAQTALSLLLLFAAAFAARPLREPMRSLFAPELGIEARMELLIGTWALPLLIGLAVRDGLVREWYEPSFALALFAVAVIALQTLLIWRSDLALTQLTKNKQRMEDVLRKNEKLTVAGRLAASISHEINNPLESISNLLYLIGTSQSVEEQHAYATTATEELKRVSQITTQTLSFYRENTAPKLSDITDILESSVQLLRGKIKSLGIDLVQDYHLPLPALVCSAGELRQVLVNLISNALDATPRGGRIVIRASCSKAWTRPDCSVIRIVVADAGSGMPASVMARVFEPFFTTKEKTGNGLGLWVAADLIDKHGGWMKVKSRTREPHRGTTFQLVLPVGNTN